MSWLYAFTEAVSGLRKSRFSTAISVTITAVSLFLLGLFLVALLQGWQILQNFKGQLEMEVFIEDFPSRAFVDALRSNLVEQPEVEKVVFVSKEEALRQFTATFGSEAVEALGENPLPASFRIKIRPDYRDEANIRRLMERIRRWRGVDDVVYRFDVLQALERYLRIGGLITLALGMILLLVSVLLISNTIRLSILAKRDEIEIMSLVGATPAFIRRPFVIEGMIQGLAGGLLAFAALFVLLRLVGLFFSAVRVEILDVGLALTIWGILLGGIGSWMAIQRILRGLVK